MSRNPIQWRSIKTRVTLFTLAVFLVSIWALAFYASKVLREDIERLLGEQQLSMATILAKDVDGELARHLRDLETVATAIGSSLPHDPAAAQRRLESLPIFQYQFNGGIFATASDGTVLADVPLATGRVGINMRDNNAVAAALDTGKPTIGRPVMSKRLKAPIFHMAVSVRNAQGQVVGTLVGATNLATANFLDRITDSRFGKSGGYLLVAPQHRLVVTATDKQRIMEASPAPGTHPVIDRFIAGAEGTAIFVNPLGVEVLQSVKQVPVAGWYVAVALPTEEAFAPIRNMEQRMLLAALLLSLLAGGLTWWLLRRQLLPIFDTLNTLSELAELAEQSASNQHPQPLPISRNDEIGQLIGGFNRLLDVLAQREDALRDSSRHLRQILDNLFAYVALLDVNGVILEINKAPLERAGYSREEVIGKSFSDFPTWSYDEGVRAQLVGAIADARQGVARRLELVAKIGDQLLPSDSQIAPVRNEHGEIVGLLATGVDISQRRQAEEQLRIAATAFEAHQGMVVTDGHGLIIKANRAFSAITGYAADELIGQKMSLLRSNVHDADFYVRMWSKLGADGNWQGEIWNRHKDGEVHPYWLIITELKDDRGTITNYVAAYTDIADRKRAEDALRTSTESLNEAQRISHIGSWTLDVASGKLAWSDEIYRLFEIDPQRFEANYEAFLNAIHPEDREKVDRAYTDSLKNRTPYEIVHRLQMADGRIKWVRERGTSEFDVAGQPLRSAGTIQDITEHKRTEDALSQAKRQMDSIIGNIPAMVFLKGADDLRFELFNRAGEELLGYRAADLLGKNDYDFFPREQAEAFTARDREVLAAQEVVEIPEERITTAHGETRYLYTRKAALRDASGRATHLLGISLDITARKQAESELRIAAAAFESLEGMIITDAHGVIQRVNRSFTEITGYPAEEVVGKTPQMLQSGRHGAEFYHAMWQTIQATGGWQGEIWDRHKNGQVYPTWLTISAVKDDDGDVTHYIGAQYDITDRKQSEERINQLAFYDQLTALPNRTLLLDRLKQNIATASRNGNFGALLFIDLDKFKTLNDTLGHDMGDMLLKQVARRLTTCVRGGDTVARLGGDEFVVMLANLSAQSREAAAQTETVGEKILAELNHPYRLDGTVYHSTASIGATLFSAEHAEIDTLLKQADLAMYKAKAAGRNAMRFFDPHMETDVVNRAALEHDLHEAIEKHQFQLHYQAQMSGGVLSGSEALVRWMHPRRGLVSPAEFIPLAEETGMILPLGQWILEAACSQLAQWASRPELAHLTIAVNVSARQFRKPDFVAQVTETLRKTGANPRRLKLELTESLLVEDVEDIIEKMNALKVLGVGFALDDFGTGYSSLYYLKRLPLDQMKIDRSFVRDILDDPNDAAIARTIVALAQSLGLGVIAEGVETEEQLDFLAELECHAYQGYYFSQPLPLKGFEEYALGI